jgi:hypothetical protein
MKFSTLTIIAVVSMVAFSSCKKDLPSYCESDLYGEAILTDAAGVAAVTYGAGSTINMNLLFINTTSDTVKLTYSEPWITYEVYSNGVLLASSADGMSTNTGVSGLAVAPTDTVEAFYPWTALHGPLPVGSYSLKAKSTYQYTGCEAGVDGVLKTIDFTVVQ